MVTTQVTPYLITPTPRIRLTTGTTVYISTTGSDATGTGSAALPWATPTYAYNTLRDSYDLSGYSVTIQMADGTYTSGLSASGLLVGQQSSGSLVLRGNSVTPSNVIISTSGNCVTLLNAALTIQYFRLTSSSAVGVGAANPASAVVIGAGMIFGACSTHQMLAQNGGQILLGGNYSITGSAATHWQAIGAGAAIYGGSITITLTGTPAYSSAFALATSTGVVACPGITFSGSATGQRYNTALNGVVATSSGSPTYLPGSVAGVTATGGQYS